MFLLLCTKDFNTTFCSDCTTAWLSFVCIIKGQKSQSTIFQSCWETQNRAYTSLGIAYTSLGIKCFRKILIQGINRSSRTHHVAPCKNIPRTSRFRACADPEIFTRGGPTKMVIFSHRGGEGGPTPNKSRNYLFSGKIFKFHGGVQTPAPPPPLWIRACRV